jgi:hypothetical protein
MTETHTSEESSRGPILWTPSERHIADCNLSRYRDFVAERFGVEASSYAELHAWSTRDVAAFWQIIAVHHNWRSTRILATRLKHAFVSHLHTK